MSSVRPRLGRRVRGHRVIEGPAGEPSLPGSPSTADPRADRGETHAPSQVRRLESACRGGGLGFRSGGGRTARVRTLAPDAPLPAIHPLPVKVGSQVTLTCERRHRW